MHDSSILFSQVKQSIDLVCERLVSHLDHIQPNSRNAQLLQSMMSDLNSLLILIHSNSPNAMKSMIPLDQAFSKGCSLLKLHDLGYSQSDLEQGITRWLQSLSETAKVQSLYTLPELIALRVHSKYYKYFGFSENDLNQNREHLHRQACQINEGLRQCSVSLNDRQQALLSLSEAVGVSFKMNAEIQSHFEKILSEHLSEKSGAALEKAAHFFNHDLFKDQIRTMFWIEKRAYLMHWIKDELYSESVNEVLNAIESTSWFKFYRYQDKSLLFTKIFSQAESLDLEIFKGVFHLDLNKSDLFFHEFRVAELLEPIQIKQLVSFDRGTLINSEIQSILGSDASLKLRYFSVVSDLGSERVQLNQLNQKILAEPIHCCAKIEYQSGDKINLSDVLMLQYMGCHSVHVRVSTDPQSAQHDAQAISLNDVPSFQSLMNSLSGPINIGSLDEIDHTLLRDFCVYIRLGLKFEGIKDHFDFDLNELISLVGELEFEPLESPSNVMSAEILNQIMSSNRLKLMGFADHVCRFSGQSFSVDQWPLSDLMCYQRYLKIRYEMNVDSHEVDDGVMKPNDVCRVDFKSYLNEMMKMSLLNISTSYVDVMRGSFFQIALDQLMYLSALPQVQNKYPAFQCAVYPGRFESAQDFLNQKSAQIEKIQGASIHVLPQALKIQILSFLAPSHWRYQQIDQAVQQSYSKIQLNALMAQVCVSSDLEMMGYRMGSGYLNAEALKLMMRLPRSIRPIGFEVRSQWIPWKRDKILIEDIQLSKDSDLQQGQPTVQPVKHQFELTRKIPSRFESMRYWSIYYGMRLFLLSIGLLSFGLVWAKFPNLFGHSALIVECMRWMNPFMMGASALILIAAFVSFGMKWFGKDVSNQYLDFDRVLYPESDALDALSKRNKLWAYCKYFKCLLKVDVMGAVNKNRAQKEDFDVSVVLFFMAIMLLYCYMKSMSIFPMIAALLSLGLSLFNYFYLADVLLNEKVSDLSMLSNQAIRVNMLSSSDLMQCCQTAKPSYIENDSIDQVVKSISKAEHPAFSDETISSQPV
ncbi:MAG: hypothetical protein CMF51_05615 [Legionellales bacterium]|nr:hypothetical protein [Legionellales bacterium]